MVQFLRTQNVTLPIDSHILIALSGGADSVALAHLLVRYGRRIVDPKRLQLLHINHGWRGAESDADEAFVKNLAEEWKLPLELYRLQPPALKAGQSWEEQARAERKKIFAQVTEKTQSLVLTAHHADDLAETVLWRLFTGAAETHGGGISFKHQSELRPLLSIRKNMLRAYLQEEGQSFREDSTNSSPRFLRAQMRLKLMPEVEKIFPRAIDHLLKAALRAQEQATKLAVDQGSQSVRKVKEPQSILLKAAGVHARRPHLEQIMEKLASDENWQGEIHLPEGWVLSRKTSRRALDRLDFGSGRGRPKERWILEKF